MRRVHTRDDRLSEPQERYFSNVESQSGPVLIIVLGDVKLDTAD